MRYLIDGHNLIAALPDISLDDPHDEAKLVEKLRSFCVGRGAQCTVVFDNGLPGGRAPALSTTQVEVIFAGSNTNADRILQERICNQKDVRAMTVVSSDREVRAAAARRRIAVLRNDEFARLLARPAAATRPAPKALSDDDEKPRSSLADINYWMEHFVRRK
ncbi:MAG: NYN domain-containing protein [Aggregatilineales bacterium]